MVKFHETLSERCVYFRYFHMMKLRQRIAHERLTRICFIDYDREMALVAEARDAQNAAATSSASGGSRSCAARNVGEFAVIISDELPGVRASARNCCGGSSTSARREGLDAIVADILPENRDMQRVSEKVGFKLHLRRRGEHRPRAHRVAVVTAVSRQPSAVSRRPSAVGLQPSAHAAGVYRVTLPASRGDARTNVSASSATPPNTATKRAARSEPVRLDT